MTPPFLKSKESDVKDDEEHQLKLDALKNELLMLTVVKNHDIDQMNVVDLSTAISIDNQDAVDKFIAEARRVRYRGQPDIDVLVAQVDSLESDGFEVLSVDSAFKEEEKEAHDDGKEEEAEEEDRFDTSTDLYFAEAKFPSKHQSFDTTNSVISSVSAFSRVSSKASLLIRNQAKVIEHKVDQLKQKEQAAKAKLEKKLSQRAAMRAVLKEESQKKKAEKAALEAARKEEKDALMAKQKELARQVLAEERSAKEAEKEMARLLLAEMRLRKQEEKAAALHAAKVKKATKKQANAVAELQAAIERVEKAQNAAEMAEADPIYEFPDDITTSLSMKSSQSGRRIPSIGKSFDLRKKWNGKKQQGLLSQSIDKEEINFMGINMNTEDMRDDEELDIPTVKSRELVAQSKDGDNNLATDQRVHFAREVDKEDMSQGDRHKRMGWHRHSSSYDHTIIEEGYRGPRKPDSLLAWIDWFMGEEECGDICGSLDSISEASPNNFDEKNLSKSRARY